GSWTSASPVDGSFNSSSEDFTFTTSALSDGTHTIYVRAQNTGSNWETSYASDTLTIDATPPTISFASPTPSNNSNLTLNYVYVTVTSNENLITPSLEWNGVNESISGSGMSWYKNKTGLSDGNYRFRVWGNDLLNNWNVTELRVVTVDTRSPTVTANPTVYPANQNAARNGSLITLNATIIDLGTGVKNATVNASHVNSSLGNIILNNNSGFWTNSSVIVNTSDGIYYLNITAYDNAGNLNNTVQITVIVDNTPPTITTAQTNYPSGLTAAKNGTSITLNASISDYPAGVKNATVNASQVNGSLGIIILNNNSGFYTNSTVIVNTSDGTYRLNITTYDNASNKNDTVQISVIVDNTPPNNITINPVTYQRGSAANNRSIIGFIASADDPLINSTSAGLKNASVNVSLINNTGRIELTNQSGIWRGNATFDKFITDDNYSLNVTFFDHAGNINNSVQINVSIDNTPPSVTNVSLSFQFIDVSSFTNISANITSLDEVSLVNQSEVFARVTFPNSTSINYPMNATGGSLFYYNFTDTAQYGRFNVTILANDTTGNINSTQRIQFATVFITNNESVVTQANNSTVVNAPLSNTTLYLFTNNTSVGAINITQSRINMTSNELTITNPGIYVNVSVSSSIRNNLSYVIIYVNYTEAEVSSYVESTLRLYRWNTSSSMWDWLSGAGSFPYVNNAGVDTTNNFVWANLTELSEFAVSGELYVPPAQTTTSSSSGGGGGGGGGGGASAENFSNILLKERADAYVFKDKVAAFFFKLADPIVYVNITGNFNSGEVTTTVEVLKSTSTLVNYSAPGTVYKNINIWAGASGFNSPKNIKEGLIVFKILNSWMSDNKVKSKDVVMVKWNGSDNAWISLETKEVSKDDNHTFFEAKSNLFSTPFAITTTSGTTSGVTEPTPEVTPTETPKATATTPKGTPAIPAGLVLMMITGAAYIAMRKKEGDSK
ncbi:MAG: PGF-pre-PGF domain-containing protein, partial [Euryarchaeota archaeon]|nr:PGF-pre-PGF domain-containing protein [Euryarchaeota archaeon]